MKKKSSLPDELRLKKPTGRNVNKKDKQKALFDSIPETDRNPNSKEDFEDLLRFALTKPPVERIVRKKVVKLLSVAKYAEKMGVKKKRIVMAINEGDPRIITVKKGTVLYVHPSSTWKPTPNT